ncbi:hypothetical protein H0H93_015606 [Arthromyces matolae]|nr:hypothetical protein H0H93_015606 [Arthromyces matolae]
MEAIRNDTLNSLATKALRLPMSDGNTDLVWNIYMTSPSDHPSEHKVWITALKNARWYIKLNEATIVEFRCRSTTQRQSVPSHSSLVGWGQRMSLSHLATTRGPSKEYMDLNEEAEHDPTMEAHLVGTTQLEEEAGEPKAETKETVTRSTTRTGREARTAAEEAEGVKVEGRDCEPKSRTGHGCVRHS